MEESTETKLSRLELKVYELQQTVAVHTQALVKAGEFVKKVGEAAIEANKPEE